MNVYKIQYVNPENEQMKMAIVVVAPNDELAIERFRKEYPKVAILSTIRVTNDPCLIWEKAKKVSFVDVTKVKK